jgi:hypothetical protein
LVDDIEGGGDMEAGVYDKKKERTKAKGKREGEGEIE